ncbi:type II secretion system pseudopilin TklG [Syntrophotalea carbinolica DSM 2380]|uniref:Type II secretion system pseudopilin TklG n=1 Tax=Syntrophotalea carbinolica (strain DSM 2380 / NBRC 103641 / GraBd1) TaxID=338963 RepID=Q3A6Z7_SYNC1|nr:type II secretion system protein [Syntrophotalea carbinolica]ABA87854.1 type II secretion system pseudopilin TklG [Syntrophotalea carbinolica DSM 2380]
MTHRAVCSERGSTLLMVLAAMVILGLTLGIAGNSWKNIVQRDREEELFFRGDQYRRAIVSFHNAWGVYPKQLDELLMDRRALHVRRHLRRLYSDPMTGAPFELVRDGAGRIHGVFSADNARPFRRQGFPPEYETFGKAGSYRDWKFVFEPGRNDEGDDTAVSASGPFQ